MNASEKIYYLHGTIEGLGTGLVIANAGKPQEIMNRYFPEDSNLSFDEYSRAVDQFCSDIANVRIAGLSAIEIVTLRVSGASPAMIETKVSLLRKSAAEFEKKKPTQ